MVNYKNREEVFSGINIVPFTDIVLVLLVIFMIAAPGIVNSGLNVSLPGANTASSDFPSRVSLALDKEGRIFSDGQEISGDALRVRVRGLAEKQKDLTVVLNADKDAQHGRVIEVLDALRSSGARNIYVGTVKR